MKQKNPPEFVGFPVFSSCKELDSYYFILTSKKDEQAEKATTPLGLLRERGKGKPLGPSLERQRDEYRESQLAWVRNSMTTNF